MKLCKNHFGVIIKPVSKCSQCVFKTSTRPCLWFKMGNLATWDCGGVRAISLSNIFKL